MTGVHPQRSATHSEHSSKRGCTCTSVERAVCAAAQPFLPGVCQEGAWLRRNHRDLPLLDDAELRRELRILSWVLELPCWQHEFFRPWLVERVTVLRRELGRRGYGR